MHELWCTSVEAQPHCMTSATRQTPDRTAMHRTARLSRSANRRPSQSTRQWPAKQREATADREPDVRKGSEPVGDQAFDQ
eukprot:2017758-Alexandrium_andersonii.AAC.1